MAQRPVEVVYPVHLISIFIWCLGRERSQVYLGCYCWVYDFITQDIQTKAFNLIFQLHHKWCKTSSDQCEHGLEVSLEMRTNLFHVYNVRTQYQEKNIPALPLHSMTLFFIFCCCIPKKQFVTSVLAVAMNCKVLMGWIDFHFLSSQPAYDIR